MTALLNGIFFGLLLSLLIGPVFFALIQTSIQQGFRSGVWLAVGISLSDVLYIVTGYIALTQFFDLTRFRESLAMAGGIIMILFGISALAKPVQSTAAPVVFETKRTDTFRHTVKGFFLNAVNPFVMLFWIGTIIRVTVTEHYTGNHTFLFFTGTVSMAFATDIGKAYLAHRLSQHLNTQLIAWMNRLVGVGLLAFGVRLIYYGFKGS